MWLIHREVFPVVPPKTEYSFTQLGSTLILLIKEICEWGVYYLETTGQKNHCDENS
ncbi:winged helix-turn-helix transcriptional regulator [Clostridium akagii]|uniref:winged helix-turn-helix transcriptional regulator n=1 Tax=Clostridium akagii TaxID=91623 RepID=UPI001FA747D3|nr:winged helix-turn-helix transcriptional regulator [Clostridium akagii]